MDKREKKKRLKTSVEGFFFLDKEDETSWVWYIALTRLRKILRIRRQEIFLID